MSSIERIDLGGLEDLSAGVPRLVAYRGPPPKRSILVVRTSDGVRAYWNVCRHLPIPLDAGTGVLPRGPEIVCQTHGARYRPEDGYCFDGPCAGAWLEAIPVEVDPMGAGRIYARIECP